MHVIPLMGHTSEEKCLLQNLSSVFHILQMMILRNAIEAELASLLLCLLCPADQRLCFAVYR